VIQEVPLPPVELMQRVGRIEEGSVAEGYQAIGLHCRERVERLLPDDWSWEGKRVLDFGCGAGRTLRHFLAEAERAEFHGCDIDEASVDWLSEHLVPPLHVFRSGEEPRLPRPDGFFDLIYAFSVFTHISDHWAGWLLELHRALAPDGFLVATFLNESHWRVYNRVPWDEERVGMNVIKKWNPWDDGGPIVFHSEWWLREHWGRAFDVLHFEPTDPEEPGGQGAMLLYPRPVQLTTPDLEEPSGDPRELAALQTTVEQLHEEAADLYAQVSAVTPSHEELAQNVSRLEAELERLEAEATRMRAELEHISHSHSWRLTRPLRAARAALRRARV
jgi:SAM-dependent methyltransferase